MGLLPEKIIPPPDLQAASWDFLFAKTGMTRNLDRDQRAKRTRQLWEGRAGRAGRALSDEDLREIEENLTGFFGVLRGWAIREAQDRENGAVGGGADDDD